MSKEAAFNELLWSILGLIIPECSSMLPGDAPLSAESLKKLREPSTSPPATMMPSLIFTQISGCLILGKLTPCCTPKFLNGDKPCPSNWKTGLLLRSFRALCYLSRSSFSSLTIWAAYWPLLGCSFFLSTVGAIIDNPSRLPDWFCLYCNSNCDMISCLIFFWVSRGPIKVSFLCVLWGIFYP